MSKHNHLTLIILFVFSANYLMGQNTTLSTGDNASSSSGSVSYSIGQVTAGETSSNDGTVSQGIQIAFEIYTITSLPEAENIVLQCTVYPNPTTDILKLEINEDHPHQLSYHLSNIEGKLIDEQVITLKTSTISLANQQQGIYFLQVISDNKNIKTFKIIKNN